MARGDVDRVTRRKTSPLGESSRLTSTNPPAPHDLLPIGLPCRKAAVTTVRHIAGKLLELRVALVINQGERSRHGHWFHSVRQERIKVCFPSRPSMLILHRCLADHTFPARVFPTTNALSVWRACACSAETVGRLIADSVCTHQGPVELEACHPIATANYYRPGPEFRGGFNSL